MQCQSVSQSVSQSISKILLKLKQFKSDASGNFGIMFALTSLPVLIAVSMAVDYSIASNIKTKLNYTLDSSALTGVTAAKNYITNNTDPNISPDALNLLAVEAGKTTATKFFNSSIVDDARLSNIVNNIDIVVTNFDITATALYSAEYNTIFGSFLGVDKLKFGQRAVAGSDLMGYLDLSIIMDNSGSMGIGADQFNIDKMKADPAVACEFACHVENNPQYDAARNISGGVVLRIDVMRDAIINMIQFAKTIKHNPDSFQFSLFTFSNSLALLHGKTTNYDDLITAMNNLSLSLTGGGTNFHYSIGTQLPPLITVSGDGSGISNRKSHVLIVTDAVENATFITLARDPNYTIYDGNGISYQYHANEQAFNPSICDALKATGATVSVLHVTYSIPNPIDHSEIHYDIYEYIKANIVPNTSTTIQKCASNPSLFYSANSPEEIKAAAITIFSRTSKPTRLLK